MRSVYIGRERELAVLLAALEDATGGRGRVLLIAGEPGIGKTALAEQLATHAVERGARALWGRCWEGAGAPPYWPWAQIVRSLAAGSEEEAFRSYVGSGAAHIARLVPELAELLGEPADSPGPADSDARRFYLFEATTRLLKNASQVRPLVLLLDDLLEGDRSSHLLLRFVAQEVRDSHLLVVATYRHLGAKHSPEAFDVLAELVREGPVLSLQGLERGEVERLITELEGSEPWPGKVTAIHEATRGNPLFVREVARLVATEAALDQPGRAAISIPDSVRAVIHKRLAPLSSDAVDVLSAAAVVGRDFDLTLVGPACGRPRPTERVLASLSEAVALGVLVEEPDAVGVYRFSHPLMREAIYEELPIPARIQMHRRVGETIERLYGPDPKSHLAELAHHFAQVAPAGEAGRALEYARRAGEQAMDACAYDQAAVEYRRALEALQFAGQDEVLRCELLLRMGGAQARAGEYQEAKRTYLDALTLARRLEDGTRLAEAALGYGAPQVEGGLVDRQLLGLLQEALDMLSPENAALRARLLARLSLELTFSEETERREALSHEAVDIARSLGETAPLVGALRARWLAVWGPDGLEERSQLAEEILSLAGGTGDRETELIGRARRITCSLELGDIRAVEADIAAHARLAGELRMPFYEWTAASLSAMQALLQGSLETAEELAETALSREPERPNVRFAHLDQLTAVRWEQGGLGQLRPNWHEFVEQFPRAGYARGWLCLADAELGREDDARTGLQSLVEEISGLPRNGTWLSALALASLAAAQLDDQDAAASLYPLLLRYADRVIAITMPHPVLCFGAASLYLGLLATATSRWEEADDRFESAIRANTRLGARSFLARARCEQARMLIRRGRAADRKRVLALLDRAAANATAAGMGAIAAEVERLRGLGAGAAITEAPGSNTFRREGDYWTIVYDGSLVRLRDSKGLRYLARLVANPGQEFYAIDLEAGESRPAKPARPHPGRGTSHPEVEVRSDLGDAGELLDAQAKAAYKARLEDLREELDEAERFNDPDRAAKAKEEIDFLASELARAVGLGGRDRRAASHAERARLNVTRAIRAAIGNLARANPSLGQHLSATIRTGRYCSYTPDPRATIAWEP